MRIFCVVGVVETINDTSLILKSMCQSSSADGGMMVNNAGSRAKAQWGCKISKGDASSSHPENSPPQAENFENDMF